VQFADYILHIRANRVLLLAFMNTIVIAFICNRPKLIMILSYFYFHFSLFIVLVLLVNIIAFKIREEGQNCLI